MQASPPCGWDLSLAACVSPDPAAPTTGTLQGRLDTAGAQGGQGFVFLYPDGQPPAPRGDGRPVQVTGVPEPRLFGGDPPGPDYTFAGLQPARYLARGIVDARKLFDPFVDVLAQPYAGDVDEPLVAVDIAAGRAARADLPQGQVAQWDPPMFAMDTVASNQMFTLRSNEQVLSILHLKAAPLPFADPARVAFAFGTSDLDGDGKPDDWNHDGQADQYPEVVLERIPRDDDGPAFQDQNGKPLHIVIPATAQPDPAGRNETIDGRQVVNGMYLLIPPVAVVVLPPDATGRTRTRQLPSLPVGLYRITVLAYTGQYWQVPNDLGPDGTFASFHGGPFASQGPRFAVVPGR